MRGSNETCGCFPTGRHYPGIANLLRSPLIGVAEEFDGEAPWADQRIAMIDVETTGRESAEDHVVELAVVIGQGERIISRDRWLINPGVHIPEETTEVHGIRDEDVKDKPPFGDVADEILASLVDAIPAAYNAPFDRGFLLAELRRLGRSDFQDVPATRQRVVWMDPLIWARHLHHKQKSKRLVDMAELLGVKLENAHQATDDAAAALEVLYAMGADERVPNEYGRFIQEQIRIAKAQEEARKMWRRR